MNNKVVARFADGRVLKGSTGDFVPAKDAFHIAETGAARDTRPVNVQVKDLKAVFFVKDLSGEPARKKENEFDPSRPPGGRKIKVVFADGETIVGTTQGYQPGRPGFFMVPADAGANTERCYVVVAATKEVALL